jgi:hypothetical protein
MTAGKGAKRPRKEEALIAALLTHPTVEKAAVAAGISHSSAIRWMKDPDFAEKYRAARIDVMRRVSARLQTAASEAVEGLRDVLSNGESEAARVSAARCILDSALRVTELEDIMERLAALEESARRTQ